jgi:hypothetical protein
MTAEGCTDAQKKAYVMAEPSCCKIKLMGTAHKRLHHKINWTNAVPKIIDEKFRK